MTFDPSRPDDDQARELIRKGCSPAPKKTTKPNGVTARSRRAARAERDQTIERTIDTASDGDIDALTNQRIASARKKNPKLPPFVRLDDYMQRPRVSWLVRDLLPASSILVVFGPPKSGKTMIALDLTMHAAHGMHWHGYTIGRPLRIAYLAGEGHSGLRTRLHAWRRHHGAELRGDFWLMPEALPLADRIADVLMLLRAYRPDVVVVDTLNAFFGGNADENSTMDMSGFVLAVRRLRDDLGCAVVVIHHTGHAEQGRERGSSVLRGAADVVLQVARDEQGSGQIGAQVVTARDMEPWDAPLSLKLVRAATDWADDEGEPIDSVIVVAGNGPVTLPGRGARPLGSAQIAVLEIARELAAQRSNGTDEVILARHEIAALVQARGLSKQSVSSAWAPLADRGLLRLVEPGSIAIKVSS